VWSAIEIYREDSSLEYGCVERYRELRFIERNSDLWRAEERIKREKEL